MNSPTDAVLRYHAELNEQHRQRLCDDAACSPPSVNLDLFGPRIQRLCEWELTRELLSSTAYRWRRAPEARETPDLYLAVSDLKSLTAAEATAALLPPTPGGVRLLWLLAEERPEPEALRAIASRLPATAVIALPFDLQAAALCIRSITHPTFDTASFLNASFANLQDDFGKGGIGCASAFCPRQEGFPPVGPKGLRIGASWTEGYRAAFGEIHAQWLMCMGDDTLSLDDFMRSSEKLVDEAGPKILLGLSADLVPSVSQPVAVVQTLWAQ